MSSPARSSDSGRTFTTSRVFDAPDGNQDRGLNKGPMLAVDPGNPQRVYVGWRQGVFAADAKEKLKSNVAASLDGGRTFGAPVDLTDDRGADFPALAVDKNGTVHAVFWVRTAVGAPGTPAPVRPIVYRQSTDHGKTWSAPVDVDPGNVGAGHPPVLAADPRPPISTWRGTPALISRTPSPATTPTSTSSSGFPAYVGKSWGDRLVLSEESIKANQYEPGLAIAPNGTVHVAWYDFRNSPNDPIVSTGHSGDKGLADVYYSSSSDRGSTFTSPIRINDRGIDRSMGVWSNNIDSKFNVGVAATNDTAYFVWQDAQRAWRNRVGGYLHGVGPSRPTSLSASGSGIPGWTLVLTGLFGLGLGVLVAGLMVRRRGVETAPPRGVASRA